MTVLHLDGRRRPTAAGRLRVALLSSPRSGNTWTCRTLATALDLQQLAVHDPADLMGELPERVMVQLHWLPTLGLLDLLSANGFVVMTVARHPLDVLVSALHFARHEPEVREWLRGDLMRGLDDAAPTSPGFTAFATGHRAARLLEVTPAWYRRPDTVRLRYEDLVRHPEAGFRYVCERLGTVPVMPIEHALAGSSLDQLRALPNRHGWRAEPGLWRQLITADLAHAIAARNRAAFDVLGYRCDPDPALTPDAALATWERVAEPASVALAA